MGNDQSYVLDAIRLAHETEGHLVLELAPTHKVVQDLSKSGFQEAKTCHSFLFAYKNGREKLNSNTLVVVDEAGMLGTELSVELFHRIKSSGAKLVLVGDDRQLSSVDRGSVFRTLIDRYQSVELTNVRRQTIDWQKAVSEDLSRGDVKSAVGLIQEKERIDWKDTKEEALASLLKVWAHDRETHPFGSRQILAQKNVEVDALNQGVRDILKSKGKLGDLELTCMTQRGKVAFAEGDRIQLTKTDKDQGRINGKFGTIETINSKEKTMTVCFDSGEKKDIDPAKYDGLRHGYASTVYKAQGSTLDHVYVLHSNTTNQATNYVALTRQTRSLSLFVSRDETPHERCLIHQMSREEGKETSLTFDTHKDVMRKQEERTFKTNVRDGVETLVTKVKDVFHNNKDFYKFDSSPTNPKGEVTLTEVTQDKVSSALQAVYQEMAHPAFTSSSATIAKRAFEKGLKVHGEGKAIAYWESRKEAFLHTYHQNLAKVETELNSPAFTQRTEKWKDQARELAQQDPVKAFESLQRIKDGEALKLKKHASETIPVQVSQPHIQQNTIKDAYFRFKILNEALKDSSASHPFMKDLKHLAQELSNDKDFMKELKQRETQEAKVIERLTQEKSHSMARERDRGGLSL